MIIKLEKLLEIIHILMIVIVMKSAGLLVNYSYFFFYLHSQS
jgi:hypothetical protein